MWCGCGAVPQCRHGGLTLALPDRLDEIAADASLQEKSPSALGQLADTVHAGCLEALRGGAALTVGGVSLGAAAILKREEELSVLARSLPGSRAARRRSARRCAPLVM